MATAAMDFTGIDEQVDTGQETDQQVDTGDINPDLGEGEVGGTQPTDQTQVDGRKGPQNIRAAVKIASEAAPEQAEALKQLAASHFRADAYSKVFPKVEDAQAAKTFIDTVGGIDGFQQIQQRVAQFDAQDEGLKTGNPEVLDAMFKDFPEGAAALGPAYLERLAKQNPDTFNNTVAPHALAMLDRAGIGDHVAAMAAETDPARAQQMAKQLDAWIQQQKQGVAQLKTTPAKNPGEDKLRREQTALHQEKDQFFSSQVDTEVNSKAVGEMTKTVDQYAKTYKLNDVQKSRFAASVSQRVINEMLGDDTFNKQDEIRRSSKQRSVENVASFRSSEFLRRLPDVAFKEAQELWGANKNSGQPTGVVKPGGAKTAPGGGPLLVSRAPDISELDMSKDPNQLLFIGNKGYKRDGTFVTWK